MAGLLDTVFGNADQTQALGLLGAGLMAGNPAAGFGTANHFLGGSEKRRLETELMRAQMGNYASEIEARKLKTVQDQRQQTMIEGLFPGLMGGSPQGTQAMPGGAPQMPPSGMGAGPAGGPAMPGGPAGAPDQATAQKTLLGLAQQLGIPPEAIKTDLIFNSGKGIAEMLYKRGTPNMKVSNGYAYNENAVQPGYLPQLNTSQDGKTSMVQIGPDGMPVVSAPQGAYNTFGNYQRIQEGSKAAMDPLPITPAGSSNPVMRSRLSVMQEANAPAPQSGVNGAFTGDPAAVSASIAGIKDPQERANAQAAFDAQMRQGGGKLPPAGGGIALADPTMEAGRKEQIVQTAKDVAEQRKAIMNAGFTAPTNIAKYQQIGKLLADVDGGKYTPAGTEFASALNGFGIKVDKNLPNKQAAMSLANEAALQLRSPAGGAGMPGAMSDSDRTFLASMTPNIAQSADGRKMVIDAYVAVQQRNQQVSQFARNYEKKYGKLDNGFFDQMQAWSNSNQLFKGK